MVVSSQLLVLALLTLGKEPLVPARWGG